MRIFRLPAASVAVLAMACLVGCATTVQLNYRTQPDGAQLYTGGRYLGTGAGRVGARLTEGQWNAGQHCVVMPPVDARWVSGAEVEAAPRRICLRAFTGGVVYRDALIARPRNAPGLGMDLDYADQLARRRLAERQTRAVEAAAAAAATEARARAHAIHLRERRERHEHDHEHPHRARARGEHEESRDHGRHRGDRHHGKHGHGKRVHGKQEHGHRRRGDRRHGHPGPGKRRLTQRGPRAHAARTQAKARAHPHGSGKPARKGGRASAPASEEAGKTSGKDTSGKSRRHPNPKLLDTGGPAHPGR